MRAKNIALAAVVLAVSPGSLFAQTADTLPVVKMVNGAPMDPSAADTYYNNRYANANTHTAGLCGLNSVFCGLVRPAPVVELSRSLSRGGVLSQAQITQNVFEYVYKNIDTEFRYGLSKGGFGALLDQSGTPFDQAHLMVELLRQSGVGASYQTGTITLTAAQFKAWTGLTNAQAACQFLANGGIPAIINGSSAACSTLSGDVTSVSLAHIWVSANGMLYDPSFKVYIQKVGVDLAAAMGCGTAAAPTCGSQAITSAIPASSQGYDSTAQANYVQNVQYAALGTKLNSFATNLQNYIQQNAPAANVQDIVGGQQIDTASAPSTGGLAYTVTTTAHIWTGDIPDQYRSRINIQFNGINKWLYADETSGYWLHVGGSYESDFTSLTATLFLELERNASRANSDRTLNYGTSPTNEIFALASGTVSSPGYTGKVYLAVDHPYASTSGAYMDDIFNKNLFLVDSGYIGYSSKPLCCQMNPFLVVQGWGRTGSGSAERAGKMASSKYPSIDVLNGGRMISTPAGSTPNTAFSIIAMTTLPKTVGSWLNQAGMATAIIDGFSSTKSQEQHSFGVVAEGYSNQKAGGFGLDVWSSLSLAHSQGASSPVAPSFAAQVAAYNALEGSAVEQSDDKPDGQSAVRWYLLANENATRFYQATSSNIESVLSATTNYNSTSIMNAKTSIALLGNQKDFVRSYLSAIGPAFNAIVAKNGNIGPYTNGGTTLNYLAAPLLAYALDGTQIGYVSTANWKGAGAPINIVDPVGASLAAIQNVKPQKPLSFSVNPLDGMLSVTPLPDLATGSGAFPYSLEYKRIYNSADAAPPECYSTPADTFLIINCTDGGYNRPAPRLVTGWRDNFEIQADFANDGPRALGADMALDASSAISALYTLRNLAQTSGFVNYLGQAFTAGWMADQIGANAIVVRKPPETETYIRLPDGSFNPRAGATGKIVQTGTRARYLAPTGFMYKYQSITLANTDKNGAILSFQSYIPSSTTGYNPGSQFEPAKWNFPDGVSLTFSYTHSSNSLYPDKMTSVSNNLGRILSFTTDSSASNDPDGYSGHAISVSDENGKSIKIRNLPDPYIYWNGAVSKATKVIGVDGAQWRINYTSPGTSELPNFSDARISSIVSPNNPTGTYLSFSWDGLFRVKSLTDANGHVSNYFPGKVSAEKFASSYVVDANGSVTQSAFDNMGHLVKAVDALGYISAKAYDNIGRLVLESNPQLGCVAHSYDVRGNEISASQYKNGNCVLGDPGNGQILSLVASPDAPIVNSMSYMEGAGVYNCANWVICNKAATQTDGKNYVTNYTWDASTGNLKQVLKPADPAGNRPQIDLVYAPLGSGASACSNGALAGGIAMLCQKTEKISASENVVTSYTYDASNKYVLQSAVSDAGGLNLRSCFKFDVKGNLISKTDPKAGLTSCP